MSVIEPTCLFKRELPQRCDCGGQVWMYTLMRGFRRKYEICCIFCGRHTNVHSSEAEARKEWNG